MKVTRLYTGNDGESHFEDVDFPVEGEGPEKISRLVKSTGIMFRETSGSFDMTWHPAPRRQFVVNLEGKVELIVGDGSSRILGPGDILLAEDITGRGHISRAVNNQPRKSLFIALD